MHTRANGILKSSGNKESLRVISVVNSEDWRQKNKVNIEDIKIVQDLS